MMTDEDKTQRDELRDQVERAQLIRSLINQPGWKDILEPMLLNQQKTLIQSFLTTKFQGMNEVVYLQQTINAIDELFKTIQFLIAQGDTAIEQLKQQPSES